MSRALTDIAFTPSVKDAQTRYGSRNTFQRFESEEEERRDAITAREADFIAARDSFYLASHGTEDSGRSGWPYVQHRGGLPGFLKVIDEKTLAFPDYRGNRQYISAGNVFADPRVALFLMDYPRRRRLKIWARARVVDAGEDPALFDRLVDAADRHRVERAFVLTVEAVDWNCAQYITPRWTDAELEPLVRPLREEIAALKARIAELEGRTPV
jgi:predicted pyridoxine 5'-phosphate oxidase superfamily flavin-nucleotide-binding protein